MPRAFDTIERGILLEDLQEILESDILHLANLPLTHVHIYKNNGKIFKPDIDRVTVPVKSDVSFIFTKPYNPSNHLKLETQIKI